MIKDGSLSPKLDSDVSEIKPETQTSKKRKVVQKTVVTVKTGTNVEKLRNDSGLGGSMGKNLSKDLHIPGAIIDAANQRIAQPKNRWRDAAQTLQSSSSLTLPAVTIQALTYPPPPA